MDGLKICKVFIVFLVSLFWGEAILTFRPRLGEENRMEWKGIKRIILEYSSLPLFESFNGEKRKSIPLFESLNE